jgi:Spy/CpxP family protein refolding chaperone
MNKTAILPLAALLLAAGCQPAPAPADTSKLPPSPGQTFIMSMRSKYGGDASKLTPEERKEMDEITRGHTEIAMKPRAK